MDEKAEFAKDLVQFTLDIVGIADPTGVADGINAVISLGRGNWLDAAISGIAVVPYVGDLAKAGKLPKYAKSVREAIRLAAKDVDYAVKIRPAMAKLKGLLDGLPLEGLPRSARGTIAELREEIASFLLRSEQALLKGVGFGKVQFAGLINKRKLVDLTQHEVRNAFEKVGLREAHNSHFLSRLIERGPEFGLNTLDDFARALNGATKRAGKSSGTAELVLPGERVAVLVNKANELITFLPLK